MDADQKFFAFVNGWASKRGCTFVVEGYDGRECDHLIDGMAADDVWGWMLPNGTTVPNDTFLGALFGVRTMGNSSLHGKHSQKHDK